jgi:hypothetical protein
MNLTIRTVDTNYVHQTWPLVRDYIEESSQKGLPSGSPDYTTDQILVYLASGQWVLVVAVDDDNVIRGAMTLSFINYPLNRVAFVTATGGKMIISKETFDQLKRIAKYHGATKIQAMARPAMVKLLQTCDMVPCNTMMEYKL